MKRHATVLLLFALGCKDSPYQEHIEREKINYKFTGTADLGSPLSGANVTAYMFSGLQKGEKLAEAISNREVSLSWILQPITKDQSCSPLLAEFIAIWPPTKP